MKNDPNSRENRISVNRTNLYELFLNLEKSSFMDFKRAEGLYYWRCPFQYDWFNSILSVRESRPSDGEELDSILHFYREKQTTEIGFWPGEGIEPASWETILIPRGFRWVEGPYGMSVDLEKLPAAVSLPQGVNVRQVSNRAELVDCADMLVGGYGFPASWREETIGFLDGIGYSADQPYRSYVMYLDEKPVATAAMFLGSRVAGIYSVATLPEMRGKGYGAAVTCFPLLEARRLGYQTGILQASRMGYPVYKRLGFQHDFNFGYYACSL